MGVLATKVGPKFQVAIPKHVRDVVPLNVGDLVQASVGPDRQTIILRPKILVDRDPELQQQLEASAADVAAGRVLGPFDTAAGALKAIKAHARRTHRTFHQ